MTPARTRQLCLVAAIGLAFSGAAAVDDVRPVTIIVKEQEAGSFLVQWRVPRRIPPYARPTPALPEYCRSIGERTVVERPAAAIVRQVYRCADGLAGRALGIDYPFLNATYSTLLKVELLSGERYAHMLSPGESSWSVPSATAGGFPAALRAAQEAVLAGLEHFGENGIHIAFLLSICLLGGARSSIHLATAFTAGQVVSISFLSISDLALGAAPAEIGVAVAAALLARETLRPAGERRQLAALAAAGGLVHGLGIAALVSPGAEAAPGFLYLAIVVLGMDAALLLSAIVVSATGRWISQRLVQPSFARATAYGVAVIALALAVGAPASDRRAEAREAGGSLRALDLPLPEGGAAVPASRRVAAQFPDAPLQSFVAVDAFEVRHEVLIRLRDVAARVGAGASTRVPIEDQEAVKGRLSDLVASRARMTIDAEAVEPTGYRVDFLSMEAQGVLPRPIPVLERVDSAWVGVTAVYLTAATPDEVALTWTGIDAEETIPATMTDPEASLSVALVRENPALRWVNELSEDPVPIVTSIAVEPRTIWIPLTALLPFGAAVFFAFAGARGRGRPFSFALSRLMFALALAIGPTGLVALKLPSTLAPSPDAKGARRILTGVLPNVYRAFEFPTESAAYDRLALSVTGETLTEVYLEHRRAVELEERGGARARVEAVEVLSVDSVEPSADGFVAAAAWTVGGTVTHFGHRHFRQNRYDARVSVVPSDGSWKIRSIEILDERRLR